MMRWKTFCHQVLELKKYLNFILMNYLKDYPGVIVINDISKQIKLGIAIRQIATLRNKITHKKVQDSSPLLELLTTMEYVCR